MEAPTHNADASAHLSDESPTGYSLMGCSPALPISASPVGVEHDWKSAQLRGFLKNDEIKQPKQQDSGSTLIDQFFCPKDGVHLKGPFPESTATQLEIIHER